MKFIVDEMPYFKSDCPFYECGTGMCVCACDRKCECYYFDTGRNPNFCLWLKEIDNDVR